MREPPRRRLKPAARRAQIIESARLAWSRTGARRTTVQHIAREAGITEHFVYRHFGSREEIFRLAVLAPLDEALARLLARLQEVESGSEEAALQRINQAFLAELPAMIPLMSAAQFGDPVEGPRFYREVLVPGVQAALLKPMKTLTGLPARSVWMNLAIRALIGAHFALALESTLAGGTVDLARVAGEMDWTFGRGFAAARRGLPVMPSMRRLPRPPVVAPVEQALPRKLLPRAQRMAVTLVAARAVFLARGLRGARTREIADGAGITEAFLFRIFSSKKRLYEASVLEPLASGLAELARCTRELRGKVRVEDLPAAYLRLALPFFAVNGPLFVGALFAELGEARDYFHNALVPQLREIEAAIAPALPQGMDPRTVRRLLSGACWAVSFDARVDPRVGVMLELLMLGAQPPINSRSGRLETRRTALVSHS
jgi:AcrR family transcriptional regulator